MMNMMISGYLLGEEHMLEKQRVHGLLGSREGRGGKAELLLRGVEHGSTLSLLKKKKIVFLFRFWFLFRVAKFG